MMTIQFGATQQITRTKMQKCIVLIFEQSNYTSLVPDVLPIPAHQMKSAMQQILIGRRIVFSVQFVFNSACCSDHRPCITEFQACANH